MTYITNREKIMMYWGMYQLQIEESGAHVKMIKEVDDKK